MMLWLLLVVILELIVRYISLTSLLIFELENGRCDGWVSAYVLMDIISLIVDNGWWLWR